MAEPQIDGCVQFYIAVSPDEMRHWSADAITMLFNGMAQVVHAAGKNAQIEILNDGDNDDNYIK